MLSKSLKVAFYGGMANNCYVAGKQMREMGVDATIIRDRLDNYAISQPMWEDHRFTLAHDDVVASSSWTPEVWDRLAEEKGWHQPDFIVDPISVAEEAEPVFSLVRDKDLLQYTIAPPDHYRRIIAIMKRHDIIFVSNVYAIILAFFSGRPFVICPAGGEFMIASGQIRGDGDVGRILDQQRRILLTAFRQTRGVLTNTAYLQHRPLVGGLFALLRHFPSNRFRQVSLPFKPETRPEPATRRRLLDSLCDELKCEPVTTKFSVFVPARIDFKWKGQDRLLEAIKKTAHADEFTFIFTGWGQDYQEFKRRTVGCQNIRVLDVALSKPFLREMYRACDVTVDQFTLGHIGTAAREAAAVGAPVMAWIEGNWRSLLNGRPDLPVINVHTADQIAQAFDRIATGELDLERAGETGRSWISSYAAPSLMLDELRRCAAG